MMKTYHHYSRFNLFALFVFVFSLSFARLSNATDCSQAQVESWMLAHTKKTTSPFKVYHWASRVGFEEKYEENQNSVVFSSWNESFYYHPSKSKKDLSEDDKIKIPISTHETQGLKYFKDMADNYFWKTQPNHPKDKIDLLWSLGMGFYAALDPIQSIGYAVSKDWILMEITVPKDVNYLYVEELGFSDPGPCGISIGRFNQENINFEKSIETDYFNALKKFKIYFIAFDWFMLSAAKQACYHFDPNINAFNFISSAIVNEKGFSWKFFSNHHLRDKKSVADFSDLTKRFYYFNKFYDKSLNSDFNRIFKDFSGVPLDKYIFPNERDKKENYLNDIYSCVE